ncbi:MAG: CinA family nicotinamide mononucleotide deamidase-related protein [Phycisphaerales bacterium JB041]
MSRAHRRAVIVSIGDELVLGQSLDTNSRWLSERLLARGVRPVRHVTVDDEIGVIAEEIERGARDADLVLVTGGLGPTADDLTREGLARAMRESLVEDAGALAEVESWYAGRGMVMPRTNRVQAMRPEGARCLSNANGTAPGLAGSVAGVDVFCLPGPPREMMPMFAESVEPDLRPDRLVLTRLVRTMGLGESRVAELLGGAMDRSRNPVVGTTASAGVVTVRMRWEGLEGDRGAGVEALDASERGVRETLGDAVVTPLGGDGERDMVETVVDLLRARGETLAVVESCTGGLLGSMVTAVPGSSAVFTGGWLTYTNAMKASGVGVAAELFPEVVAGAPGAVSGEVAVAMALGGLARARHTLGGEEGADHVLAITGIAGPDGGSEAKPVGTVWVCRASRDGTADCRRFEFVGGRGAVREWAANTALGMLRLRLAGVDMGLLRERERTAG